MRQSVLRRASDGGGVDDDGIRSTDESISVATA